jgi:hypothetical protein
MTIYKFRNNTRSTGVDAQTAGEELQRICDKNGCLDAAIVVDESRPADAALHPVFQWDDQIAAEEHRKHQARSLIRSVHVIRDPELETEPCYVHIASESSYLPAEIVVRNIDLYGEAQREAIDRINQALYSLDQLIRMAAAQNKNDSEIQQARELLIRAQTAMGKQVVRLRTYQQQAAADLVAVLQKHRVAYLRGEVRVGKTFTALEALKRLGAKSCLIVTKKKAIPSIETDRDAIGLTAIVEVTNFEQVPKRAGRFYDVLVVDEAHSVGAYPKPSKRWHDLRAIRYKHIILMSGTPSPESYSQLYHQFALSASALGLHQLLRLGQSWLRHHRHQIRW